MSYQLNEDLSQVLVHMESVLDLRLERSDALVLLAEYDAGLSGEQIELDGDITKIEALENEVEHLSEQIT